MSIANAKGKIFYGLHFYPGVAEYREPGKDPYRVFINEDTIRAMGSSFAGRPVFVQHVDGVEANLDELRKDADGWVVESFYNSADGKHWVKFIVVSERGEKAIRSGMKLSNCYLPKSFGSGGLWNGVEYAREIMAGEYEHLAIVPNPRYEESVIMSPDEFKAYNENKIVELKRVANNGEGEKMKLKFFKRAKVENAIDLEETLVVLPKSGREVSITQLVNEMDAVEEKKKEPQLANGEDMVDVAENKMTVNELVAKYNAACEELKGLKENKAPEEVAEEEEVEVAEMENKEDEDAKKKALELVEHEEKEIVEAKAKNEADAKAAEAKAKADRLRNAHKKPELQEARVEIMQDQVVRGKARYGS